MQGETFPEAALEPDLPICDPHHHLFDHAMFGKYLLEDFAADIGSGHNIEATVFVDSYAFYSRFLPEEMRPVGEVTFAAGMAAIAESGYYGLTRVCAGIVGFADLRAGARVAKLLEAQIAAGGGRFRGIRQIALWNPGVKAPLRGETPPELYKDAKFREGFAKLGEYGLSFDACVFHTQLDDVLFLANAFPETPVVLNHVGIPLNVGPYAGKTDEVFAEWKTKIDLLGVTPNVWVKLGGLGMPNFCGPSPSGGSTALAEAWRPYIETSIEAFGVNRAMFESNFPVDKQTCSYAAIWNAFKRIAAGCGLGEKRRLFRDSAMEFYKLDL